MFCPLVHGDSIYGSFCRGGFTLFFAIFRKTIEQFRRFERILCRAYFNSESKKITLEGGENFVNVFLFFVLFSIFLVVAPDTTT